MASVQSAPGMMPGVTSLPPNLTPQNVKDIHQKYEQMRAQGFGKDNAEYAKLHGILAAVQQQHMLQKQRQLHIQQQQQQQQQQHYQHLAQHQQRQPQPSAAGAPMTNGAPERSPSMLPSTIASTPPAMAPAHLAAPVGKGLPGPHVSNANQNGPPPPPPPPPGAPAQRPMPGSISGFTAEQLSTLRNQIMAFKMLSKNVGIPAAVQQQLFPSHRARQSPYATQATAELGQTLDPSTPGPDQALAENGSVGPVAGTPPVMTTTTTPRRQSYETFRSPYDHLPPTIGYAEHGQRSHRVVIPSIMPVGVDADRFREERERVIYNRMLARKAELEKLPANIGVWDAHGAEAREGAMGGGAVDDSLKLKAILEYKMLCLLPKQRALRQRIGKAVLYNDHLAMTTNRNQFRRMKKQSYREARITEKLEKEQRDARENREKRRHADYLQAVLNHGREMHAAATAHRSRLQKLGRIMTQQHAQIEKEEQKRIERTAKQRLQALKSNDEDAYLRLLDQAKDTRITHLLRQTNGFLKQLAASVKEQQRSAAEQYGDKRGRVVVDESSDEEDEEEAEDDGGDDDDARGDVEVRKDGKKIDYYEVAHRIKEEVKEQPGILVGGTLKEYQIKGLQWMISLYNNNLNGILADEMGLGKTIQTISLITYLIEKKKQNGPFLVIVPLSTLTNWNLEFEKWAPSVSRIVYKGPPNARKQQQQAIRYGNFQVLLTTYEFIIKDRPVLSKIKWTHMIVDEGHRMKNAQSKLSSTLTQHYTTRYRLILTGTPLQNNLPELWALLNFVLPAIFKSVKSFDEWFNTPFANTGGQDKMELTEEEQLLVIKRLHKVLRPFLLRRLKKDVEKDLPDKQERVIKCVFSALQAKLYKQMMTDQRIVVSDGKGGKTGIRGLSNMLMQLRKLCNHPFAFQEVEDQINPSRSIDDLLWRTAGKFELLDRILPKFLVTGHRVLMFFQMTNIMNIMEDYMRLRGMQYLRLDGTTKSDDRSELLKQFNAPNSPYFCFLLSTRAGGLGLNLQTADTVIIFDSDWNPHQDLQAQDRAHRIGQKNEVRILRLISANSVEEKILERAQYKLDMDGKVIQAGKFDNKSTNEEREALLRTLLETADATENMSQEEMDDDDLNMIMSRSDEELELFKRMDVERERDSPYGPNKRHNRLLSEDELPDIYLHEGNPTVEEPEEIVGRGARQRTQVRYDDGLTEEQWLEAVDADDDTVEDAVARKQARIAKRIANKEKRTRGSVAATATSLEDSPAPSRDDSEAPPPPPPSVPKKRGRKSKAEKRKADEAALEELQPPPAKRKRGRQSKAALAAAAAAASTAVDARGGAQQRGLQQKVMQNVFKALMDLEAPPESDEDEDGNQAMEGRPIIDPFVQLPSKKLYPDYYMVIKNPVSMDQIKKRINKEDYRSWRDFREDVLTLCNNARTYNEDSSLLFQDANTIEAECNARLKVELAAHPQLGELDDQNSSTADGRSTAPVSSAGTPLALASSGGSKLRLTFNSGNHGTYANGGAGDGGGGRSSNTRRGSGQQSDHVDDDDDDDDGDDDDD